MSSVVELWPARRQEVLNALQAEMKGKLEVIRNANESCRSLLCTLHGRLQNCRKVLRFLPPSEPRCRLEAEIADKEAVLKAMMSQAWLLSDGEAGRQILAPSLESLASI